MKQVLGRTDGVITARMPIPGLGPREVLVLNHYSLISTGTEISGLRSRHENRAAVSPCQLQRPALAPVSTWKVAEGCQRRSTDAQSVVQTAPADQAEAISSPVFRLAAGARHSLIVNLRLLSGNITCGLHTADGSSWLVRQDFSYPLPELCFRLDYSTPPDRDVEARLVLSNHRPLGPGSSSFRLLDATWLCWQRTPPSTEDAQANSTTSTGNATVKSRVKKSLAHVLARVTGESAARHEAALQTWWRWLNGRALSGTASNQTLERPIDDTPEAESTQQGWAIGYSSAGEVIAVGSEVRTIAPGDWVACAGAGRANHAEVVAVPVNLVVKLPPGIDTRIGCSTTIGAIALQGIRRANLQLGERVAIIGLGLIGQLTAQLARAAGCKVVGFDPLLERVDRARQRGLDDGAATEEAMTALTHRWTAGHGVDVAIITAAARSAAPINLAMQLCRRRGRVVISGDVDIHPQRAAFYQKEIDLCMATSYGPGRYDPAYEEQGHDYPLAYARWTANRNMQSYLEFLAGGRVEFLDLVDVELTIDQAADAYDFLVASEQKPLAVVLRYPHADSREETLALAAVPRLALHGSQPLRQGPLNFVLVGAGAFGQGMLVPRLLARPDMFQFYGVVSRQVQGCNFARSNRVPHVGSDLQPFLDDPDVHLLVIATRHHEHADQALAGLRAGKHVFVEKPLAITWDQLDELMEGYVKIKDQPKLMVGFNRRFSPALLRLGEVLANRRGPLMMTYRVHAGRVPFDHWVQSQQGGGRNIGEACHFYDVFRCLAGAAVTAVQALPIGPSSADLRATDNFMVVIRYADGSLANLVYTALGPKEGLAKERLEVFCDNTAYLLDDYCRLTSLGDNRVLWQGDQDKGHTTEIEQLGAGILQHNGMPIAIDTIYETTALALTIEDLLNPKHVDPSSSTGGFPIPAACP